MFNNASGASATHSLACACVSALTCGRMTLSMLFRAVSGEGGEQSGVGPVVQSPWLLRSTSVTVTWDRWPWRGREREREAEEESKILCFMLQRVIAQSTQSSQGFTLTTASDCKPAISSKTFTPCVQYGDRSPAVICPRDKSDWTGECKGDRAEKDFRVQKGQQ